MLVAAARLVAALLALLVAAARLIAALLYARTVCTLAVIALQTRAEPVGTEPSVVLALAATFHRARRAYARPRRAAGTVVIPLITCFGTVAFAAFVLL